MKCSVGSLVEYGTGDNVGSYSKGLMTYHEGGNYVVYFVGNPIRKSKKVQRQGKECARCGGNIGNKVASITELDHNKYGFGGKTIPVCWVCASDNEDLSDPYPCDWCEGEVRYDDKMYRKFHSCSDECRDNAVAWISSINNIKGDLK